MPFYLFKANYSAPAIKAMIAQPQDREAAGKRAIKAVGGKLHSFFFALGDWDTIAIIEAPDDKVMVAASMIVGSTGSIANASTTKLLTSAEAMEAMKKADAAPRAYTPPYTAITG